MSKPLSQLEASSKSKRKKKSATSYSSDEDLTRIPKPGLTTGFPHIAQMFLEQQPEIALEVSRHLTSPIARRLGVRRQPLRPMRAK